MNIPKLSELVSVLNTVRFVRYADNQLWYVVVSWNPVASGFEFPVPISDTGNGVFLAEDKSILFMRWIRKYREEKMKWMEEAGMVHE